MNLHIGCGDIFLDGYINCDIQGKYWKDATPKERNANVTTLDNYFKYPFGTPRRDVIVDQKMNLLEPWPFESASIDKVVMISCIEHFTQEEALFIISEIKRVLVISGEVLIDFPDLAKDFELYYKTDPKWYMTLVYCNGKNPYSLHRYGYTAETFKELWPYDEYYTEEVNIVKHKYPMIQFKILKREVL